MLGVIKLRGHPKAATKTQGGVRIDPALVVHDLVDPAWRDTNGDSKRVLLNAHRYDELLHEDRTGVGRILSATCPSVVVDDFRLNRTRRSPDEADTSLLVDADTVLCRPIIFAKLKAVTRRTPGLIYRSSRIQGQQFCERLRPRIGSPDPFTAEHSLGLSNRKRKRPGDHHIAPRVNNVSRYTLNLNSTTSPSTIT